MLYTPVAQEGKPQTTQRRRSRLYYNLGKETTSEERCIRQRMCILFVALLPSVSLPLTIVQNSYCRNDATVRCLGFKSGQC